MTMLNLFGVQQGKSAQKVLTTAKVLGVLSIVVAGLILAAPLPPMLRRTRRRAPPWAWR
jgi:amino acid transporter